MALEGQDNSDMSESMRSIPEKKHTDIWQLFREAQQNILYLNKQRMMAMEELDNMKREKKVLLDRIKQLEIKKQLSTRKDKLSIRSELLLRLDSMVLTGMIGTGEASDLRKMIMDSKVTVADNFSDILHKRDAELLAELCQFSDKSKKKGLHIVHICTEMAPVISVGSLASYVTGLSRALQRKGHSVEVILPKYATLNLDEVQGLREIEAEFYSYFNGQLHVNRIWTGVVYGIGITFIQPIYYSSFFSLERVYGYSNDFERFTYFSRASLDYIVKSGKQPDVLHIHNWQTAIVGPLFWDVFVKQGLGSTRILLTCQDFDSQCLEQPDKLGLCGLDPSRLHRHDRLQDNTKTHLVNILKGGIVYSNKVVIMSSMHSKGLIIHSLSYGLESTLAVHKDKLLVAPCGFDNSTWNPSMDHFLPQSYSVDDMKGKAVCKIALQQHVGISENPSIITVGCIFSEVSDVDLENLKALVCIASRKGVQFIFMGMRKIEGINRALESFEEELKDDNVRFLNEYDEALSHLIFAGSDIILCQSFDDPVLQVPLKALRYGAAPVAATLIDNQFRQITDYDFESTEFSQYINNTFGNVSLSRAIDEIKNNPSQWNRKIMEAMTKDFSWDAECCDKHVSAYTSILNL
ncbi:probable starch synthase 4, chloroplastic/amyloplastic isoform X2 [Camellia sinensis]|uniref:probable starch synthase 4, chloroplastic/amyloplastic isoform X2 n=1 Tax=Camellia sinensis TaxID=4442 RepID=UPI001036C37D|nr:probable starch synthase 4, chloroplastic/amyloplastic isoform X2 [Camellia sinensis]